MSTLAYVETPFITVTAVVADCMLKQAGIRLLGFEPVGIETLVIRIEADNPADAECAVRAGVAKAKELGVPDIPATVLANPDKSLYHLNDQPVSLHPIYGGRDEMRPLQPPSGKPMNKKAIGILETQGLTAVLHAADAMFKTSDVELVRKEKIGAAYVAIMIRGDVAAVQAAIDAGVEAVGSLGKLIAAQVITGPHADFLALIEMP